jgi:hypothetical protein
MDLFPIPFGIGDKVSGIDRSLSNTESGLLNIAIIKKRQLKIKLMLTFFAFHRIMKKKKEFNMSATMYDTLVFLSNQVLTDLVIFLPKLIIAFLVLVIGAALARTFKGVAIKLMETLRLSKAFQKTPVEHFLTDADLGGRVEEVIGAALYWLVMLVVIHTTVSILGLTSLTVLLGRILAYLPSLFSAVIILFFGLLIAGIVESLVKGAVKSIDGRSSRLLGKISSYSVMVVSVLAAVSELGIASEFIFILFVGFVITFSLALGLAFGLGGKDVVNMALTAWYKKTKSEVSKK